MCDSVYGRSGQKEVTARLGMDELDNLDFLDELDWGAPSVGPKTGVHFIHLSPARPERPDCPVRPSP